MNFNYIKWIYAKSGKGAKHWVSSSPSLCSKRRRKSAPGQQTGHLYSSQIHEQVLHGIGMVMDVDAQYGDRWMTFMNCLSVLSLVPFQSRTGSHKYSMRAFEAVDCHIGDLQTSHTATQLSVMIGNHAQLSWLPVRVHLASKVPHWTTSSSSSETGWRKWVDWLIASCRLCLFSPMAVAFGADMLFEMFVWDKVWHRLCMLPIYKQRLLFSVKIMALGRRRSGWSLQVNGTTQMVVVMRTLALCPSREAHILQSVTTKDTRQHSPPHHSLSTNAKQTKSSGKFPTSPRDFLLFCRFLDSRKKNKTEKEATFLY